MRLFTAIDLPSPVLMRLERLIIALRPEALIKWSPLDNLHITTKFIGEWPEERLDEVHEALSGTLPRDAFELEVQSLGWFPNEHSPRVLWAGVQADEALQNLAGAVEDRLLPLGIAKENRPYSPHLTLARIKNPVPLRRLREKIQEMNATSFGTVRVSRFALFRSDPGSNSSLYRKLHEYRFESAVAVP